MSTPDNVKRVAFISYRRQDSAGAARWLYSALQRTFGPETVFMDVEGIRASDDWAAQIQDALERATLLIAVVGPHWLRIADEFGRRRLDRDDDWVRNEISDAIRRRLPIIPVLLSKTPLPAKEALPEPLQRLGEREAFDLRDTSWERDIAALMKTIEDLGFQKRSDRPIRYPKPQVTLAQLSTEELDEALRLLGSDWQLVTSDIPGRAPLKRTELQRIYEFRSFEDAMKFMADAAPHVSEVVHHPRWENLWRTVTVWLSTWDIGSLPSVLDVDLARHLDGLFATYKDSKRPEAGSQPKG
jgi:pterin-4a-carbinolamine dehydratase